MKFFKYKISYFCEYDAEEREDIGLVCGENYGDAANHLCEDYGEANVIEINLKEIVKDGNYCLGQEDLDYYFKEEEE